MDLERIFGVIASRLELGEIVPIKTEVEPLFFAAMEKRNLKIERAEQEPDDSPEIARYRLVTGQ
jgi:hypothetical protein